MMTRTRWIAVLVFGGLALSGCSIIDDIMKSCDYDSTTGTAVCRPQFEVRSHSAPITAADLAAFDAADLTADLGQGNVPVLSTTSTATLRLKLDGTTYASNTFTVIRSGDTLRLSNPAQVNTWLRAHGVGADGVQLDIDGVKVGEVSGTNVFSLVLRYLGSEVAGTSHSWHRSRFPDGDYRRLN